MRVTDELGVEVLEMIEAAAGARRGITTDTEGRISARAVLEISHIVINSVRPLTQGGWVYLDLYLLE